jgi:RNA binding exosome subunit
MNTNTKLTRKELADFISAIRGEPVSFVQVRDNEKAWGLTEARGRDLNKRWIRYDKQKAVKALLKAGVIDSVNRKY